MFLENVALFLIGGLIAGASVFSMVYVSSLAGGPWTALWLLVLIAFVALSLIGKIGAAPALAIGGLLSIPVGFVTGLRAIDRRTQHRD